MNQVDAAGFFPVRKSIKSSPYSTTRDQRAPHSGLFATVNWFIEAYGLASLELGVPLSSRSVFYMASVSKQLIAVSIVLAA